RRGASRAPKSPQIPQKKPKKNQKPVGAHRVRPNPPKKPKKNQIPPKKPYPVINPIIAGGRTQFAPTKSTRP
ncbi:hypothetical protein PN437_03690, partial [Microcystis aeruginosa CS-564/01]|uniref:hypothetical protein n=1 Tax=Microcystis aeruginosa TaxID=1126 RepID=UPI003B588F70|nr:hypothetical protein [Microcystis aeruginosa CS-564/01]